MAHDFRRSQELSKMGESEILQHVLRDINSTLESLGMTVNDYRVIECDFDTEDSERLTREIMAERGVAIPDSDLHALHELNLEQRIAFDKIFPVAVSGGGGAFFADGPGGTGKSFLYKVLPAHIRSLGKIAIIVATSGIVASGFTVVKGVRCQMSVQSSEAHLLRCY
ncbi:hypothetical protein LIER_38316 [Lithospermum erythrorhizon]|uniref:ATP-dependent DNA helicase n=1 Tax=Lithospermum erythrorhizon TaxID=34254 RepID=A0AAV3PYW7_LITER